MKFLIHISVLLFSFQVLAYEELDEGEGYILVSFRVENGYLPYKVTLSGSGFFNNISIKDIYPYSNFELVAVKAGTYTWDRIYFTKSIYLNASLEDYKIEVKKGRINYGGTLSIYSEMSANRDNLLGGANLNHNNKSSRALFYLETKHRELLSLYPLNYGGTQNDEFFEFARSMELKND